MNQPSLLACVALMSIVSACSSAGALKVPTATDVRSIDATISNSYDPDKKVYIGGLHIDEPNKITEILGAFKLLNHDMSIPFGTFPTPTHSIVVKDSQGINLVIFVGVNWIGGQNIVSGKITEGRTTRISDSQRTKFLKTVGIRDYRFK